MPLDSKGLLRNMHCAGFMKERHYNRLGPIVPFNVDELKKFKTRFWDYYGDLLNYYSDTKPLQFFAFRKNTKKT